MVEIGGAYAKRVRNDKDESSIRNTLKHRKFSSPQRLHALVVDHVFIPWGVGSCWTIRAIYGGHLTQLSPSTQTQWS